MRINNETVIGLSGWKSVTPAWAAIASNYLMLATVGLFVLSGFIDDWANFIPETKQEVIGEIINAVEKTFVTIGTGLRFLGLKDAPPVNENMYGIPHDNG